MLSLNSYIQLMNEFPVRDLKESDVSDYTYVSSKVNALKSDTSGHFLSVNVLFKAFWDKKHWFKDSFSVYGSTESNDILHQC